MVLGVVAFIGGQSLPSGGLIILAVALVAAGLAILIIARSMPARTMAGAMIYAMLAAYRRTLQKTMEQARSMEQVVQEAKLDWLETPDQAVVWGIALGLQTDIEQVLERSAEDVQAGVTDLPPVVPALVRLELGRAWDRSGPSGIAPGLFASGRRNPRLRRDDVCARHDRQLAQLERVGWLRWLQRWRRRWRRRRGRRRLLGLASGLAARLRPWVP